MTEGTRQRPTPAIHYGLPGDDPLTARIFPALPGEVQWGLDRTRRILASLGNPHLSYPVLHVGGTNGKGSVARIWAEVLTAAGLRVGLYTSPHLVSFRERILVGGTPLPDELLEEWSRDLRPLLVREAPSFFEAATALGLLAFSRAAVDAAVVEVGMGGRLDATNVVQPILTAVTNVDLDHTAMLGETIEKIAREKAGILKPGVPVFTAAEDPVTLAVLTEVAASRKAVLYRAPVPEGRVTMDGITVSLETSRWGALDLESPLVGRHQMRNLALAVHALEALPPRLPVSARAVREGAGRARVPGRFQVEREDERTWVLDIAHNLAGARALADTLARVDPRSPRVGLVGILKDKPYREMVNSLQPVLDALVLIIPSSAPDARRWDPGSIADLAGFGHVDVEPSMDSAIATARRRAGPLGTVVVTGSTYTVGECLKGLGRIPKEALPVPFDSG